MPSTTSTTTTVPANSFSATRCAVVAPTFPAPTTVILLTMSSSLWGEYEAKPSGDGSVVPPLSPADLRQRAQSAHAHLQQLVLFRLVSQCLAEQRLEPLPGAQRRTQIHFVVSEQAR